MAPQADPARGTDEKFLIECLKAYDGNKVWSHMHSYGLFITLTLSHLDWLRRGWLQPRLYELQIGIQSVGCIEEQAWLFTWWRQVSSECLHIRSFTADTNKRKTNSSSKVTKSPRAPRKKATKAKPEDTSSEVEASPAKNDQATSADEA